ncbi:MAG: type II secretion system F family protein [Paracoccaceae bacterium]
MFSILQDIFLSFGITTELLLLSGIGIGTLIVVFGISNALARPSAASRRMRAPAGSDNTQVSGDLIHDEAGDPRGVLKAFVPSSRKERTKIAQRLRQGGAHSKNAVRNFYIIRTLLGIVLPACFIGLVFLPSNTVLPFGFEEIIAGLNSLQSFQVLTVLVAAGFFGPSLWLGWRIKTRRTAIEQSLPNALDLLQVAVEAGMGFDAALSRVAEELARVAPQISEEFIILQLEIQAGKPRDRAFVDMADRTGVEEVSAFANVIVQSVRFGTSISDALMFFSEKMRQDRELRAQEKANKLPVKMSGIMAAMMMPTLLMICLTPVVIRWMNMMM